MNGGRKSPQNTGTNRISDYWPERVEDAFAAQLPILTDRCTALLNTSTEGHPWNNKVDSINLLFGDGHVELNGTSKIQLQSIAFANGNNYY